MIRDFFVGLTYVAVTGFLFTVILIPMINAGWGDALALGSVVVMVALLCYLVGGLVNDR